MTGNNRTELGDITVDQRLGQSETLYVTVRADSPKASDLVPDGQLGYRGRRYSITELDEVRVGADKLLEVEAAGLWVKLADDVRPGSFVLDAVTALDGLTSILETTSPAWVGEVDASADTTTLYTLEAQDATVLDLIRQWAKITGNEFEFDTEGLLVRLIPIVGATRGVGFRYGRNVRQVRKRTLPPAVTRLYPYGKNDLDIRGVNGGAAYLEDFTFYTDQGMTLEDARRLHTKETVLVDTSIGRDTDLLAFGERKLAELSHARISYELDVVDLSELTGLDEDVYNIGDRVIVADDERAAGIETRVSRIVRKPKQPHLGRVELSYLPVAFPDPGLGIGRASSTQSWELYTSRNATGERRVLANQGTTVLGRIDLATIPGAQWVVGYSLNGVAVGTGTLSVTAFDAGATGDLIPVDGQVRTIDVVDGEPFSAAFTYGELDVASGQHSLKVRAELTGATRVDIPINGTALWVLARGATERTATLTNSIRFDFTGAVQQWTIPDDVTRLRVTAVGAPGGPAGEGGGAGGSVAADFDLTELAVSAGDTLDVYVGGTGDRISDPGWPNGGGRGRGGGGNSGNNGGGSSVVRAAGSTMAGAFIVAPAGGGTAQQGLSRSWAAGNVGAGAGGFYEGTVPTGAGPHNAGSASQLVPTGGTAGATAGAGPNVVANTAGELGQGGSGGEYTSAFVFPGGGGGGGWYGGGGAGGDSLFGGGFYGGDGGGGCGYVDPSATEIETSDASNLTDDGYVIIEWEIDDVDV